MSDRKQLIRIASELPKGSEARRVLLAEIQKEGQRGKPGHEILEEHLSDKYGYRGKMNHFWFDGNLDGGGKSSKVPTNLSPDNPHGPKEKWKLVGGGEWLDRQHHLGLPTTDTPYYGIWWTIEGDFTRYTGPSTTFAAAMPWTGKGKVEITASLFENTSATAKTYIPEQVDLDGKTVSFSFTDGNVGAIKKAFDKAIKEVSRQAQAAYARLSEPQVWSAVIGIDGEASHIQTFRTEADAKKALSSLKGIVSYDVVEGEQLWNKSVGTVAG
jgi:hypothetical protein